MISNEKIISIVSSELSNTNTGIDYETPLDYYIGESSSGTVLGRSTAVSRDVADAVEWIMPQIMKSFTQNNEIVIFDPIHEGDEFQADLESEYAYEVLMKENEGFIILHEFVKDALLQNNGIIKVYYEDDTDVKVFEFTGINDDQLQGVTMDPRSEIISLTSTEVIDEATQQVVRLHDTKITITTPSGKISIESVAPENFVVNSDHSSISLENARFTAHLARKTRSELIKEGYDPLVIDDIGNNIGENRSDYRFAAQGESENDLNTEDESMQEYQISECFMHMDIDEDGISEYVKVVVAGYEDPTDVLSIDEIGSSPWVSTTAILMSHKFRGLSIYDRLYDIQDQKTALLRNSLDNIYLQNNQRFAIVENQVNVSDMLVSRPGGLVRVKRIDAVSPLPTPQLSSDAFNMMSYFDTVRAGRVGVSPEGEAAPQNIGERVGSEGLDRLMDAKEELVGLIVRVIAETGVKPLCTKIRDLCTQHLDAIQDFKFRGQWVKVNPATWVQRSKCTVRVGTGTGNHASQVGALREIVALQGQMKQEPGQILVDEQRAYSSIDDLCKFTGLNGATKYFVDPSSPEGQQKAQQRDQQQQQQQQKMEQQEQMALQLQVEGVKQQGQLAQSQVRIAEAEVQNAKTQMINVGLKNEIDVSKNEMQAMKQMTDLQVSSLKQQLEEAKAALSAAESSQQMVFDKNKFSVETALKLTELEANTATEQNENYEQNRETTDDS